MQAVWVADRAVHVGAVKDAPASAVHANTPPTRRLEALKAGTPEHNVQVKGRRASRTVTVR
jgi:hypothetical protein